MNTGRTVFAQLLSVVPFNHFEHLVDKYKANYWVRTFTAWNHFVCLAYAQFTRREGLRDLVDCLSAQQHKLYHLGLRRRVTRSTLAEASERRDCGLFESLANRLVELALALYKDTALPLGLSEPLYAMDSTTIDLCLKLFAWADFRQTKAAIKAHTVLDLRSAIPVMMTLTTGKVHDVHGLDMLNLAAGSIVVVDRAYVDFKRLYALVQRGCHFVVRAKANMVFELVNDNVIEPGGQVLSDEFIYLTGVKSKKLYPKLLRRVRVHDPVHNRELVFISNRLDLPASTVAAIYKQRWKIELFFKWLKQNLCIKHFFGNSENAVKTQLWIAVCVYLMALIAHKQLNTKVSLRNFMHLIESNIFERVSLQQLVDMTLRNPKIASFDLQESLF
jgi:Transposase DDE domain/Domain of unknown function (DUF4372)